MASHAEFTRHLAELAARHARVRFTYYGGSHPEDGRNAFVIGVDDAGRIARIREGGATQSKTMLIERIGWVVDMDGDGVTVTNDDLKPGGRKPRATKIARPSDYFAPWAYRVQRHHWELLGVTFRTFMLNRKPHSAWAIDTPPSYDFLEGTVFYRGQQFLQVAFNAGDGFIEVHTGTAGKDEPREGWLLSEGDLAHWLASGARPQSAHPLNQATSNCDGLLRTLLKPSDS